MAFNNCWVLVFFYARAFKHVQRGGLGLALMPSMFMIIYVTPFIIILIFAVELSRFFYQHIDKLIKREPLYNYREYHNYKPGCKYQRFVG